MNKNMTLRSLFSLLAALALFAAPINAAQFIKYRVEDGPGKSVPPRPSITAEQASKLERILSGNAGGASGLPDALAYRVVDVVFKLDLVSGTRLTKSEWDAKLETLSSGFAAAFPAGKTPSADEWEKGLDKLLVKLVSRENDPHTMYFDRAGMKRMQEMTSNAGFVGIGAHVETNPEGIGIARSLPGSPARNAGIRKGDVITAVDKKPTKGMALEDAVTLLRGTAGTTVNVTIRRGTQEFTAKITRAKVTTPISFASMPQPGIGYVYFAHFADRVDAILFAQIDDLMAKGARKLIIDVRGNPGGLLNMAQSIVSEFLKNGQETNSTRTRGLILERSVTDGDGRYANLPLAVLTDAGSASASEVLAAAMQDHARAKIIGGQSYGKGTFQSVMPTEIPVTKFFVTKRQPDGAGMKVTSGGWHAPSGRNIDGKHDPKTGRNVPGTGGVVPDVPVRVSEDEAKAVQEGIDEQLFGAAAGASTDSVLKAALDTLFLSDTITQR